MIKPRRLVIDGFMGFGQADLDLSKTGVTHIKGPTGSGKSSIFETVHYLLIGDTVRDKQSVEYLANKVSDAGYKISLFLEKDENQYEITEVRGRKGAGLTFIKNGTEVLHETDPKFTRKKILAEFEIDQADFCAKSFIGQGQVLSLVTGTPGARAKEIVRMFKLDKYDQAIKRCDETVKSMKLERSGVETSLSEAARGLMDLESVLSSVSPPDDKEFASDLKSLEDKESVIKKKIGKIREIELDSKEKIGNYNSIKELLDKASSKVLELKESLKSIGDSDVDIEDVRKKTADLGGRMEVLNASIKNRVNESEKVKLKGDVCPIDGGSCPVNRPIEHKASILSSIEVELSKCKSEKCALAKEKELADAEYNKARSLQKIKNDLQSEENWINENAASIEDVQLDELKAQLDKCKSGLLEGEAKLAEVRSKISDIKVYNQSVESYKTQIKSLTDKIESNKARKSKLEEQLLGFEGGMRLHTAAAVVLKKLKMYKIDFVISEININLQKFLDSMFDGELQAYFKSQDESADGRKILDRVTVEISDPYKTIPVSLASGGQNAYVTLPILLAILATARSNGNQYVNTVFLDEVFGPISNDMVGKVFSSMKELCKQIGVESVKLISHKDIDESLCDEIWETQQIDGISHIVVR